jgi:hypothetical protein
MEITIDAFEIIIHASLMKVIFRSIAVSYLRFLLAGELFDIGSVRQMFFT